MKKEAGILVSIGKSEGFYKAKKQGMTRIGLGCVAITFMPFDGDKLLVGIAKQAEEIEKMKKDYDAARCIIKQIRDNFAGLEEHESFAETITSIDEYLTGLDPYSGVYEELELMKTILVKCRTSIGLPFTVKEIKFLTVLKAEAIKKLEESGKKWFGDRGGF